MTSTFDLVNYYANLLIYQYNNKSNAYNTIVSSVTPIVMAQQSAQSISFSLSPTSGTFVLSYNGSNTASINWDDSTSAIQTKINSISALSSVVVEGSITDGLTINFVGVLGVAELLTVFSNSLLNSSTPVLITIEETDLTLPLAVQNAFDIETAVGVQLNILGKYAGVTRTINTPSQTINLNDSDFRTLIKFAVIQNNSGSSLQDIELNLNKFFAGNYIVVDYKTMRMSYIFSSSIGSPNFFLALIKEKLVPKPMAVGINVLAPVDITTYFGFSLYESGGINNNVKPYNTYEIFNSSWIFLQYQDFIF